MIIAIFAYFCFSGYKKKKQEEEARNRIFRQHMQEEERKHREYLEEKEREELRYLEQKRQEELKRHQKEQQKMLVNEVSEELYNEIPKSIDEIPIAYNYKHEKLCQIRGEEPDISKLKAGQKVNLLPEPQNKYDKNAIAVYHRDDKIGYLYRGNVQDIANKFNDDAKARIFCFICEVKNNDVFLNIGFYREKRKSFNKEITFKLTRTANKDIQETIESCVSEDDELEFNYDYDKELFAVCPEGYDFPIGYAPKSKSAILESLEETEEYEAYVSEIDEDDNGKYIVYITIKYN